MPESASSGMEPPQEWSVMIVSSARRPRRAGTTRVHGEKVMMPTTRSFYSGLAAMSLVSLASIYASGQQPAVKIPEPGVPQVMTLEGKFVRVAYNNEGYVILGYQIANRTVGEDWVMLDVGITMMEKVPTMRSNATRCRSTRRTARWRCRRSRSTGRTSQRCRGSRTA